MILHLRPLLHPRAVACLLLAAGGTGCAMRATTDFGPQAESSRQSVSAGAGGLPGFPIFGSGGPPPSDAAGGNAGSGVGGSPFSTDGAAAGGGR